MKTRTQKRIEALEAQVKWLEEQLKSTQPKPASACEYVDFSAHIDGTEEIRGTKLNGVETVILPNIGSMDPTVRLKFSSLEDAAAVLKKVGEQRRMEIRIVTMCLGKRDGDEFKGHRHVMEVSLIRVEQAPLERRADSGVLAVFDVGSYAIYAGDEKLWETKNKAEQTPEPTEKRMSAWIP